MGWAYGALFKEQLAWQLDGIDTMYPEIGYGVLEDYVSHDILDLLSPDQLLFAAKLLLDLDWAVTSFWTPQRFVDEI